MLGLYLHLPFCLKKCHYCNFISFDNKSELLEPYLKKLREEFNFYQEHLKKAKTIYFGGGTPSLISASSLAPFITPFAKEITLEVNPETVNLKNLAEFYSLGINRLSIGAQSFSDHYLKLLGRIHDRKKIIDTFKAARKVGFKNINLDLIYALPEQRLKNVIIELKEVLKLSPEHISIYNLEVSEESPLSYNLPTNEEEALMFQKIIKRLTKDGYRHYEISSFAKKGFECQHNLTYWQNKDYLGLGVAAHSHFKHQRWANPTSIEEYLQMDFNFSKEGEDPLIAEKERILMGLRLLDEGINLSNKYHLKIKRLKDLGLIKLKNQKVYLTKKGLFLFNQVLLELF